MSIFTEQGELKMLNNSDKVKLMQMLKGLDESTRFIHFADLSKIIAHFFPEYIIETTIVDNDENGSEYCILIIGKCIDLEIQINYGSYEIKTAQSLKWNEETGNNELFNTLPSLCVSRLQNVEQIIEYLSRSKILLNATSDDSFIVISESEIDADIDDFSY